MYKEINILNIVGKKYYINEYGIIYSKYSNKIIKPIIDSDGYYRIALCVNEYSDDNTNIHRRKTFHIHKLVMLIFNGSPPSNLKDPTVDHIDYNTKNNYYKNLRWLSRSDNTKSRRTTPIGEANGSAILRECDVVEICELMSLGVASIKDLAIIYNVEKSTISNIRRKTTWVYISTLYDFKNKINSASNRKRFTKEDLEQYRDKKRSIEYG